MKTKSLAALLMLILPITWASSALADAVPFTYTTDNGAITITAYTGSGGHVEIPETIDGFLLQPLAILRSADARAWHKR
jgi:hypothetical protein